MSNSAIHLFPLFENFSKFVSKANHFGCSHRDGTISVVCPFRFDKETFSAK
jgi:hypothetical protein